MKRFAVMLLLLAAAHAAADTAVPQIPPTVAEFIELLRDHGHRIAYSSRLVPPDLPVTIAPGAAPPIAQLIEILDAHGLTLEADAGVFLVVRKPLARVRKPDAAIGRPEAHALETIVVSASRYEIARDIASPRYSIDRRSIETLPDVGNDPLRATQRLPGTAASGASARTHFRGGDQNEVGIILDGNRLFDPFHVRDYQNIFSAVDARAIAGVEVFTGGFPVRFGDRMSGVVLMESIEVDEPRHTEIGLSVFNTSFLNALNTADTQWVLSARRGNLDLVIDPQYGQPNYYDAFTRYTLDVGERSRLSVNALYARDNVRVVLESDPAEREAADSATTNAQAWAELATDWSDRLSSRTLLAVTDYSNLRTAISRDTEKIVADVRDRRDVREIGFRQDWGYRASGRHFLRWGFGVRGAEADYDYDGRADYFGLPALYAGQPGSVVRTLAAAPSGGSYALYVSDRWQVAPTTILEWGLRWDDQTYTDLASDAQLSPRLSLLHRVDASTDLRLSFGRYHQSQGIHELQIEDGITRYWPAQRADHLIAGIERRFGNTATLRVEAFHKVIRDVRPRFENLFDPLALIPEFSPDRVRLDPSRARATGFEVSMDARAGDWSGWAAYTLSRTTDRIDGRDEPRSWDQRHALQGGVVWSGSDWTFAVAAAAHTGWPTTNLRLEQPDPAADPVAVAGRRNAHTHPGFVTLDFRVSRRFPLARGYLTAFVEVSNATNRQNVCCLDWDVEEDADGNPVLENSLDYWLPLLPAIGVLWEF